jgi:hypothetical protein
LQAPKYNQLTGAKEKSRFRNRVVSFLGAGKINQEKVEGYGIQDQKRSFSNQLGKVSVVRDCSGDCDNCIGQSNYSWYLS